MKLKETFLAMMQAPVVSRFLKKNNPYFLRICDGDQYQANIKGFFCLQHCMTKRFLSSASIIIYVTLHGNMLVPHNTPHLESYFVSTCQKVYSCICHPNFSKKLSKISHSIKKSHAQAH